MRNNSGRHAYIMMVHNEWRILRLILDLLDDERNDFFIHVDLKVKIEDIPYDLLKVMKKSRIFLIPRMNVTWGGDSQIYCVYNLLKAASNGHYRYYHFISGIDMPLLPVEKIFQYFNEHDGENFFEIHKAGSEDLDRVRYYYFYQNKIGKGLDSSTLFFQKLKGWMLALQKLSGIDRIKNKDFGFYKGEVWFSITDELIQYFLTKEKMIKKLFSKTWCGDELCWGSIAMNGKEKITTDNCLRFVDWEHGNPYIFQKKDYERIMQSGKLFARKFSDSVDSEVVDMIYESLSGRRAADILA